MKPLPKLMKHCLVPLLGVTLLVGACSEFEGLAPPTDALHFPVGMAIHPDGRYLYVLNTNFDVAYAQDEGGTVTVIDTDTLEIKHESTVTLGSFGGEIALSPDARHLYVAVRGDNSIVRLDVSESGGILSCRGGRSGLPCRIEGLSGDPFALAVGTQTLNLEEGGETEIDLIISTHLRSSNITAISIKDNDVATEHRLSAELIAGGSSLAVHPRTGRFYVTGRFDSRVRSFAPVIGAEGDISAIFGLSDVGLSNPTGEYDSRAIAFSMDGDRAYVAARSPNAILVLDTSSADRQSTSGSQDELIGQIDLMGAPEDLIVVEEQEGEFIYALELASGDMTVVDPRAGVPVDRFPVGRAPAAVVSDQVRHQRLYVTLFREAAVAVIDIDPESRRYRTTIAKIR